MIEYKRLYFYLFKKLLFWIENCSVSVQEVSRRRWEPTFISETEIKRLVLIVQMKGKKSTTVVTHRSGRDRASETDAALQRRPDPVRSPQSSWQMQLSSDLCTLRRRARSALRFTIFFLFFLHCFF